MAEVTCRPKGLDRLRLRLAALPKAAREAAGAGLRAIAEDAAEEVRRDLEGTGRDAFRPIAAAVSVEADPGGGVIRIDHPAAESIEFGTARMPARPVLRPAAARAGQRAVDLLKPRVNAALKREGP